MNVDEEDFARCLTSVAPVSVIQAARTSFIRRNSVDDLLILNDVEWLKAIDDC